LVDGVLLVSDFETMAPLPPETSTAFPVSYDLTGEGLTSPHNTQLMCYRRDAPEALGRTLGVDLEAALDGLRARLKDELREACSSFKAVEAGYDRNRSRRHICRTGRIYGSFSLPYFAVAPSEAQRDSAKRFAKFGLREAELGGRSLLDLGSNVGGMTFAAQVFAPGRCVGVEYDADKIRVADRIARFCGLSNVEFRRGDIDHLDEASLGGPFDVVFSLAIERHVASIDKLFALLGRQTRGLLVFEGNDGCDVGDTTARLRRAGFRRVDSVGVCDDDIKPENNKRPLILARKS